MPGRVRVIHMFAKVNDPKAIAVDTTSKAGWSSDLSPFKIGPCDLYGGYVSLNHENSWQFSKVYPIHAKNGEPKPEYWDWAKKGWANPNAVRFPMGKGKRPLYSLWDGEKLGYIDARKKIYGPLYAEAVQKTAGWDKLKKMYEEGKSIVLRDYDGYDHAQHGLSLVQVLNNPKKIMGHAFILKMLLINSPALGQLELR